MVFIRENKPGNTNLLASRHRKREKALVPVDVHCSKKSLLKLPNIIKYFKREPHKFPRSVHQQP